MSMNNYINASVEFYFKGNKISASIELDLDQLMQTNGHLPLLYPLLAKTANLDPYSYEYEIMQAEEIRYSNPRGMVEKFVINDSFDIQAFELAWQENNILEKLHKIAASCLGESELARQPELTEALLAAYRLGCRSKSIKPESVP